MEKEKLDLVDRIEELEAAIRIHRDARGQDRCWENDLELYALLPEGVPEGYTGGMPTREEFLAGCAEYFDTQVCRRRNK